MEYVGEETIIEQSDNDEGWVETHHFDVTTSELEDKVCDMTLDGNKNDDEQSGDMERAGIEPKWMIYDETRVKDKILLIFFFQQQKWMQTMVMVTMMMRKRPIWKILKKVEC